MDKMPYDFSDMTLAEFQRRFEFEDDCLDYIIAAEYPDGHVCDKCGRKAKMYRIKSRNRKSFCCGNCGRHWSPLATTIFRKTNTPLRSWFYALWLISHNPTKQLGRILSVQIGVTYKTGWRMSTLIHSQLNPHYRADRDLYRGVEKTPSGTYRMRIKKNGVRTRRNYNTLDEARGAYLRAKAAE